MARSHVGVLALACSLAVLLTTLLVATAVRGVYIVDEDNYAITAADMRHEEDSR